MHVGIDIGGTFTDAAFVRSDDALEILKVPSTPAAPERAVTEAFRRGGAEPTAAERFVHGTTIVTNMLIERTGRSVALVTTAGFEDILELQFGNKPNTFDLTWTKPDPFVPRPLRFGVNERIDWTGEVLVAMDSGEVDRLIARLRQSDCASVAICLLNSHANPEHERLFGTAVRRALPDVHCCLSSDVDPAIREYERASTTVLNAYAMPAISDYIRRQRPDWGDVHFMSSSGGAVESRVAEELPISLAFSGPAGGVIGAAAIGKAAGYGDLITFDMGGTSTDVAIVRAGRPDATSEMEIDWGIPYRFPSLDIRSVGAGGGSMLWVDDGGALRVGPRSANVTPGPVCYGTGGETPTVTDINVALGLVPGESFGGGSVTIDRAAGEKALERLGRGIGKSADEVAFGAWRIVNANMAHAIRQLTVYRGIDPRAFSLFSFGSAAGQHAVEVARELRMPRVVVPAAAPVFSAVGMLAARLETYGSASVEKVVDRMFEDRAVAERISALENDLLREADDPRGLLRIWTLECRHVGQTRTINIDFHPATDTSDAVRDRFLDEHRRLYGMHGETGVEVVNARLCVATADPEHRAWRPGQSTTSDIVAMTSSEVLMDGMAVDIVPRAALSPDDEGEGPALIADSSSTVYIPSDCRWRMDAFGSLVVEL